MQETAVDNLELFPAIINQKVKICALAIYAATVIVIYWECWGIICA